MHGLLLELLIGLEQEVTQYVRDALWSAIQAKKTFFSMVTTLYLHFLCEGNKDVMSQWRSQLSKCSQF